MKTPLRSLLLTLAALVTSIPLVSAAIPAMDVTVSNAAGKLAYRGKTDRNGTFATPKLAADSYVVQFNAKSANGGPYALVVSAGKKKSVANSVTAAKLSGGGVAMKLVAATSVSLTGQITEAAATGGVTTGESTDAKGRRIKYVNGKKYVWVTGELGSNLGGQWQEEGSGGRNNVQGVSNQAVENLQQGH